MQNNKLIIPSKKAVTLIINKNNLEILTAEVTLQNLIVNGKKYTKSDLVDELIAEKLKQVQEFKRNIKL